jgi:hypothetical protein
MERMRVTSRGPVQRSGRVIKARGGAPWTRCMSVMGDEAAARLDERGDAAAIVLERCQRRGYKGIRRQGEVASACMPLDHTTSARCGRAGLRLSVRG